MIELSDMEVDAVSGAMGLSGWISALNTALDFFTGFVDGVNAATGG